MKNKIKLLIWNLFWSAMIGFRVALYTIGHSTLLGLIISVPALAFGIYKFFKDEE